MAGLWFASLIFSFPDVVSSILFGLAVSLFILSTVLVSWKRPEADLRIMMDHSKC